MIGISKERLVQIANETHDSDDTNMAVLSLLDMLIKECRELQEPWMTLDEFLKLRSEGLCWVRVGNATLLANYYDDYSFEDSLGLKCNNDHITHVMPIHKPEPPK